MSFYTASSLRDMAGFMIIRCSLSLLVLTASCYCASYRFGGTIGAESHLNLTSTGFGTLKANDTANSGIGVVWNGTVYGGAYGRIDDVDAGVVASVSKTASLKPGDSLGEIKSNDTVYRGRFFFGDLARRFFHAIIGGDTSLIRVNEDSVNDTLSE